MEFCNKGMVQADPLPPSYGQRPYFYIFFLLDPSLRDKRNFDLKRYTQRVADIDWQEYYGNTDINWINNFLEERIREILDMEAPLKGFQARSGHQSWITQELKEMMKTRDIYKVTARQSGNPADRQTYKRWKN